MYKINMFDFHSLFLDGKLDGDEEIFMEQPTSYEESDLQKYCLKLYKSIYRLKQDGCKWYKIVCCTLGIVNSDRIIYKFVVRAVTIKFI